MIETMGGRPTGDAQSVPGIADGRCNRCGALVDPSLRDDWGRVYCRECLAFGLVREDTVLWRAPRPVFACDHILVPGFPLSSAQSEASRFVLGCRRDRASGLLHAVCGAGKTEILYAALLEGLQEGWKICVAIPRKDIVAELTLRFRRVFPQTVVKELHEGSKDDTLAHLVISTIHQLIRYFQEFDWIVLDEADAFPYRGDPLLDRLLRKALRPEGALFLMSATLDPEMRKATSRGDFRLHTLPARFHCHPLDVPHFVRIPALETEIRQRGKLPGLVASWLLSRQQTGRQALLFVPSVAYGLALGKTLVESGFSAGVVSSRTPPSERMTERFRGREWMFLVTTTLLERGVTFSAVDVAVFSADHRVFNYDTLVQIAGRAGRDPKHPHGEVVFYSEEKTQAMVRAAKEIRSMNRAGGKAGLLTDAL